MAANAGGFVLGASPAPAGVADDGGYYGAYEYGGYQSGAYEYGGYQSADGAYGYGEGDRPGGVPHRRRRRAERPTGGSRDGPSRKKHGSRRRRSSQSGDDGVHGGGGSSSKSQQPVTTLAKGGFDITKAELAAATIETWSGLDRHQSSIALARRGELPPEAARRLTEAEREAEALRMLLQEERRRITREVRSLKSGWETADKQSREFEQQALALRCSEASLTRELATADALTDWWRRADKDGRKRQDALMAEVKQQSERAETLAAQLDE